MGNICHPQDVKNILARINRLEANSAARWGKMNVGQAVVHLSDQIRCAKGDLVIYPMNNMMLKTVVKWLILAGMKAPKGRVKTAKEFDQDQLGTKPTEFARDRDELVSLVNWFHGAHETYPWQEHPAFGKMTKRQWGKMVYTHLDHHLGQFGA